MHWIEAWTFCIVLDLASLVDYKENILACSMQRRTADLVRHFRKRIHFELCSKGIIKKNSRMVSSILRERHKFYKLCTGKSRELTVQDMFSADDRDWTFRGNNLGLFNSSGWAPMTLRNDDSLGLDLTRLTDDLGPTTIHHLADKPNLLCLSGTKVSSHKRELPDFTVIPGDLGQALQGADICCEADVDFRDGKPGVGCA